MTSLVYGTKIQKKEIKAKETGQKQKICSFFIRKWRKNSIFANTNKNVFTLTYQTLQKPTFMTHRYTLLTVLLPLALWTYGQDNQRIPSSTIYLIPTSPANTTLAFDIKAEGKRFQPIWGLDQAWISEQNLRKGINHMGKENIGIGRSAFRMTKPLINDTTLTSDQTNYLRNRNNIFNIVSDTLPLVLTADQEAGVDAYYRNGNTANVDRWSEMINAHVKWLQKNSRHRVAGVSPFNEPDYWTEEGATTANSRDIAKKLKEEYPIFSNIAIVGANTLNDDKAEAWYTPGKAYYDWGNTHQLAGSMNNYKAFHQLLQKDGKIGYNDEMHNVAEAFIGLEYGMDVGIWWGFDSRARGEFCDISRHGVRLGYAEHPANWTAASVWRHDDGRVKAFIGSSERQAYTTSYRFISRGRDVYFDGEGPTRDFKTSIHGGTGYQKGQKNAERVFDVTWGEDVAPSVINGTYKIMNKATQFVVAEHGTSGGNTNISQVKYNGANTQQWEVYPVGSTVDGDYSFYDIKSVNDGKHLDVLNYSTQSGGNVIAYGNNPPSSNQQWYLEYAGDGYYFIRNRESALYLSLQSNTAMQGININQQALLSDPAKQLWRFLPLDAECETEAPATPSGLTATAQTASVLLEWEANQEPDFKGYTIVRAENGTEEWNTIARQLTSTQFIDNNCRPGTAYEYRIKAIDHSDNQSALSEAVMATPTAASPLMARWKMEDNLLDETENQLDAVYYTTNLFTSTHIEGEKSLNLNGTTQFMQLPYEIASGKEMTFAAWVNWRSTSTPNQRLFDFGNGSGQYIYLTPSDGNAISLVIKNGEEQQTLSCDSKLTASRWKHVAVTLCQDSIVIYIDGVKAAHTAEVSTLPSDILPTMNYVGRGQLSSDPYLKAFVDDIQIFSKALNAQEITAVMDAATNGIFAHTTEMTPETCYYTLDGIKVDRPTVKGIYIKTQKDTSGTLSSEKIIIR